MKLLLAIVVLSLCGSCVGPRVHSLAQPELSSSIDQLCAGTGLKRTSPIKSVEQGRTTDPGYTVRLDMAADRRVLHYVVRFDSHYELLSFKPEPLDLGGVGLGADTVKEAKTRAICTAAVARLNRQLHWKFFGRAAIQKVREGYLVTYETVSEEQQKRAKYAYLDPYVSFLVTPDGTVFGVFLGA
jgi:hypothetical protein